MNYKDKCKQLLKQFEFPRVGHTASCFGEYFFDEEKGVWKEYEKWGSKNCSARIMSHMRAEDIPADRMLVPYALFQGYTEENKPFYDWLFYESPFKNAFEASFVEETSSNIVFIKFGVERFSLCYAASIIMRVWEYSAYQRVFNALVERGVEPAAAAMFKYFGTLTEDGKSLILKDSPHETGHTWPYPSKVLANNSNIKNWLNNRLVHTKPEDYIGYADQDFFGHVPYEQRSKVVEGVLSNIRDSVQSKEVRTNGYFSWVLYHSKGKGEDTIDLEDLVKFINKFVEENK